MPCFHAYNNPFSLDTMFDITSLIIRLLVVRWGKGVMGEIDWKARMIFGSVCYLFSTFCTSNSNQHECILLLDSKYLLLEMRTWLDSKCKIVHFTITDRLLLAIRCRYLINKRGPCASHGPIRDLRSINLEPFVVCPRLVKTKSWGVLLNGRASRRT